MGAREMPLGITTTAGTLAVVACCAVPSAVTGPGLDARLAVLAMGLAAFAAWVLDATAVAVAVGVGFLLFDGFVEGAHGDLVWHGPADLVRLGVLCLAGAVGLLAGAASRWWRQRHPAPEAAAELSGEAAPIHRIPRQRSPLPTGSRRSPG